MIFKNNLKVTKLEIKIKEKEFKLIYHFHLSDDRVWTYEINKLKPSMFYDQNKLELAIVHYASKAMVELRNIK